MKKILFTGAAVLAFCAQTFAADVPTRAPGYGPTTSVAAPTFTWTGLYIGGNLGGLIGKTDFTSPNLKFTHYPKGWLGGIQGGFDWQTGMWVFGVQADYDWADASAETNFADGPAVGTTGRTKIKAVASVTGRLGIAIEQNLLYVKGGGAWVRDDFDQLVTATGLAVASASATQTGGTIGAGWEYAFFSGWSGFIEYDYYFLNKKTLDFTTPGGAFAFIADIEQSFHVIKGGINYRFNFGKFPY